MSPEVMIRNKPPAYWLYRYIDYGLYEDTEWKGGAVGEVRHRFKNGVYPTNRKHKLVVSFLESRPRWRALFKKRLLWYFDILIIAEKLEQGDLRISDLKVIVNKLHEQ